MRKRVFDVVVISAAAVAWVPVVVAAALAVLVLSGRPIFYRSQRWVGSGTAIEMLKLRVMVPHANKVVTSVDGGRFLSTPIDSPLYTPVGRILDRLGINEIPQFIHVLKGEMCIVGARPLTNEVLEALTEQHDDIDGRWLTPAGLTGLPQLVGRCDLTDDQRLSLEASYAARASLHPSIALDFQILLYTVLITFGLKQPLTYQEALDLARPDGHRRRSTVRFTRFDVGQSRRVAEIETDAVA